MHPITTQIMGHDLHPENEHKVSFEIRAKRGAIKASFDKEDTAREFIRNQQKMHGSRQSELSLFKITVITEKL